MCSSATAIFHCRRSKICFWIVILIVPIYWIDELTWLLHYFSSNYCAPCLIIFLFLSAMLDRDLDTIGSAVPDGCTVLKKGGDSSQGIHDEANAQSFPLPDVLGQGRQRSERGRNRYDEVWAGLAFILQVEELPSWDREWPDYSRTSDAQSICIRCWEDCGLDNFRKGWFWYSRLQVDMDLPRNQQKPWRLSEIKRRNQCTWWYDHYATTSEHDMMTYLDCVLKESMRLWPVLSQGVPRELRLRHPQGLCSALFLHCDLQERHWGNWLEVSTWLDHDKALTLFCSPRGLLPSLIMAWVLRTSSNFIYIFVLYNIWKDPDLFKPDNWAPDHPSAAKMKELFFPLSLSKRNCIGQNLANMKVVLAQVCRNFRLELVSAREGLQCLKRLCVRFVPFLCAVLRIRGDVK